MGFVSCEWLPSSAADLEFAYATYQAARAIGRKASLRVKSSLRYISHAKVGTLLHSRYAFSARLGQYIPSYWRRNCCSCEGARNAPKWSYLVLTAWILNEGKNSSGPLSSKKGRLVLQLMYIISSMVFTPPTLRGLVLTCTMSIRQVNWLIIIERRKSLWLAFHLRRTA